MPLSTCPTPQTYLLLSLDTVAPIAATSVSPRSVMTWDLVCLPLWAESSMRVSIWLICVPSTQQGEGVQ